MRGWIFIEYVIKYWFKTKIKNAECIFIKLSFVYMLLFLKLFQSEVHCARGNEPVAFKCWVKIDIKILFCYKKDL